MHIGMGIFRLSQILEEQMMTKLIHMMIRVLDEARSCAFYDFAFSMKPSYRLDFDDFSLIYLRDEGTGFEIELTINKGRNEPYDIGGGYGHAAFVVQNLDAEHRRFTEGGLRPQAIKQFDQRGQKIARFFFVEDPDGYKIEVLEAFGHYG